MKHDFERLIIKRLCGVCVCVCVCRKYKLDLNKKKNNLKLSWNFLVCNEKNENLHKLPERSLVDENYQLVIRSNNFEFICVFKFHSEFRKNKRCCHCHIDQQQQYNYYSFAIIGPEILIPNNNQTIRKQKKRCPNAIEQNIRQFFRAFSATVVVVVVVRLLVRFDGDWVTYPGR